MKIKPSSYSRRLFGGLVGAFVLVMCVAEQAQGGTSVETDAESFATQPTYCGDGSHTIQAEDVLIIKGGQGLFAAGECTVTMLDRAELRFVSASLSGSGELLIRTELGARQAVHIRDSSLATGRLTLQLLTDGSEIECVTSSLHATSDNIGLHSGPKGETELRGCELRSDGPPPFGSNVFVSNIRDGSCQVKDSHLTAPRGHIFVFRGPQAGGVRFEVQNTVFEAGGTAAAGSGPHTTVGSENGWTEVEDNDFRSARGLSIIGGETVAESNDFSEVRGKITVTGSFSCKAEGNSPTIDCEI